MLATMNCFAEWAAARAAELPPPGFTIHAVTDGDDWAGQAGVQVLSAGGLLSGV